MKKLKYFTLEIKTHKGTIFYIWIGPDPFTPNGPIEIEVIIFNKLYRIK